MFQSHTPTRHGLNTTRGYDREVPSREVALFLALLVLPFAFLLAPSLFAS
jgi:hypothetical protein